MAVEAPDKEERENPVRNFVGGTSGEHKIKWVTAIDPKGKKHKLHSDNASDWKARGPGWRVTGPWVEEGKAVVVEEDEEDDTDPEEEDEASSDDEQTSGDDNPALKKLHDMRDEAAKLGVNVNEQWGMKRLQREIDGAKLRQKQS
jgi:hypothetical protein